MKHQVLLLGGAYEFLPTSGDSISDKKRNALAKAFQFLNYDLGILSPAEFQFLQNERVGIPQNWISCKKSQIVTKSLVDNKKAAIIILPYLEKGSDIISADILENCASLIKEQREIADIVIVMSSWGYFREKKFLAAPEIAETPPDLLLGSGDGPGMTGSLAAKGKTLWVRSYPTGKAVNRIDILQFPERNSDFKWISGNNVKWFLQTLLKNTREDLSVVELLSGIEDEK